MISIAQGELRGEILNSWKDVAHYLGRSRRTVQRWERELALPVRRPRGKTRSAVFALRPEIDLWVNSCPQAGVCLNGDAPRLEQNDIKESIRKSRALREEARISRRELQKALHILVASLDRLRDKPVATTHSLPYQRAS